MILPALRLARTEAESTIDRCVKHLASTRLPGFGHEPQESVGRWVSKAAIAVINHDPCHPVHGKLRTHGIRLVNLSPMHEGTQGGILTAHDPDGLYLAIAGRTNKGMGDIFAGSDWGRGIWMQVLALVPGAFPNKKARFDGPPEQCVMIPIEALERRDAASSCQSKPKDGG